MDTSAQHRSDRRLWRTNLNGLLYVPKEARYVLKFLETGGPSRLISEWGRLWTLGSPWASAMLGYIGLIPGPDGTRNTGRAVELCKAHADAGDSYAQFVLAWALIYKGEHNLAIAAMKKAAQSRFPPATIDFVTFIWNGLGTKDRYPSTALKLLKLAEQANHKSALIWRCMFYRSGQFGVVRRLFGYLFTPFARLRYVLALWIDPFSCRVFVFQTGATGPLFRPKPPS